MSPGFAFATLAAAFVAATPAVAQRQPAAEVRAALSMPGSASAGAQTASDRILIYVYVLRGRWKRLDEHHIQVETKPGSWMAFPSRGMASEGMAFCAGDWEGVAVRLPRERLDEIRQLIEAEVPPHKWEFIDEAGPETLPPHMHSWGCAKF